MAPTTTSLPRAVFGVTVDHVPDDSDVALEAMLRADRPRLLGFVNSLPVQERHTIVHHYGLYGVRPQSLRAISRAWGVAPSTAHAWHRSGIELLREWF